MKHYYNSLIFALAISACAILPAEASVINFDDIDASAGDVILDSISPYQGYNWANFSVYTSTPGFPGFNNGIVSAPNAAYTSGDTLGSPIVSMITAPTPFSFISGYFGSGWYDGLSVTVNGLFNGTQDFTQTFTVNTEAPQFFTFNFTDINELDIFSTITAATTDPYGCGPSGCSQVTLDNLTLTPAPQSSTPEPAAFALAGIGMVALAATRRLKPSRKS